MKTMLLTTTVLAAFAITATANPKGPRPHRPDGPPKALIEKFDTDGDGKLSEQEREAAKAAMGEKRDAFIAKYDKDGDGKLNEEERKAAREEWKGKDRPKPPGGPSRERIIKRFDKDGDGKLNEEEREAAKAAMKEWREKHGKDGGGDAGGGEDAPAE